MQRNSHEEGIYDRPDKLEQFIGQSKVTANLRVFLEAAKKRGETIDHILFSGPPGLGKTTLSRIIAKETNSNIKTAIGPMLNKAKDIASLLTGMSYGEILFIDEIHRISKSVEEMLYSAMEDYRLDIVLGEGTSAKTMKISLPKFTLIGATTRSGMLSRPLYDRFGIQCSLELYSITELLNLLAISARSIGLNLCHSSAMEIAKRSRGTPRIALRHMRRIRDFLNVSDSEEATTQLVKSAFEKMGIDQIGLSTPDINYLNALLAANDAPLGLETLSAAISESGSNVEENIEPYLLKLNFIGKSQRGRYLTKIGKNYIQNNISIKTEQNTQAIISTSDLS